MGQGSFKIEILLASELGFADAFVHEIGNQRSHNHQRAHDEQPDNKLCRYPRALRQSQRQEGDERYACHTVGFEAVGCWTD